MGVLLGIVCPSVTVPGWGLRQDSAGKTFPRGRGRGSESTAFSCIQCSVVYYPSPYLSLLVILKDSEKSSVHNGFLLVASVGRHEVKGGLTLCGERSVVTGAGIQNAEAAGSLGKT